MVKKHKRQRLTRSKTTDLVARPKTFKLKPHHAKPYRKRHLGALAIASAFLILIVFQLGFILGESRQTPLPQPVATAPSSHIKTVKSGYGFSFDYEDSLFKVAATTIDEKGVGQNVVESQLPNGLKVNLATLRPKAGTIQPSVSASQFSVQIEPDATAFSALKANPETKGKTDSEIAAKLLPLTSTTDFDVTKISQNNDTLEDGTPVTKTTYQYTPKFSGGVSYAVVWNGVVNSHPFSIKLGGLISSSSIPAEYKSVFSSLRFTGGVKVRGISFRPEAQVYAESKKIDDKYLSDTVSPAVVKIYHVVCGTLIIRGNNYGDDCEGMTGSGFLVSSDGYIATNGHVAVLTAKDIVVEIITSSPESLLEYLRGTGLTDDQIATVANDSQKLASVIAKVYDMSDDEIRFDNEKEVTIVALGKDPLEIKTADDIKKLVDFKDTENIKRADVIGYDYSGKDTLVAQSGDPNGFSASDVALLKINTKNAPLIKVSTEQVTQNEKITVLGFPGDAENSLVDNSSLDVSVTDGSISAIKQAAGGKAKLYQSDADASHGNSGGPAVTGAGEAFGLLTYRISGDDQGNAAKSYMRDIADFTKLAKDKNVTFNTTSSTQDAWREGLDLFSQNHFSAAKKEFVKVKQAYPAHRLVGSYIDNADKQIAAGNDVKLYSPVLIVGAIVVAVGLVAGAVVLIVRQRARHQAYASHGPSAGGTPPVAGAGPVPPIPPVMPAAPTNGFSPSSVPSPGSGPLTPPSPAGSQPQPVASSSPPFVQSQQVPLQTQSRVDQFVNPAPTQPLASVSPVSLGQPAAPSTVIHPTEPNPSLSQHNTSV